MKTGIAILLACCGIGLTISACTYNATKNYKEENKNNILSVSAEDQEYQNYKTTIWDMNMGPNNPLTQDTFSGIMPIYYNIKYNNNVPKLVINQYEIYFGYTHAEEENNYYWYIEKNYNDTIIAELNQINITYKFERAVDDIYVEQENPKYYIRYLIQIGFTINNQFRGYLKEHYVDSNDNTEFFYDNGEIQTTYFAYNVTQNINRIAETENKIQIITNQNNNLETQNTQLQNTNNNLTTQINNLESTITQQENTIEQLQNALDLGGSGNAGIIDLRGMMLDILAMPWAFISQAFNVTLWENTPYEINFSNIFMGFIAIMTLLFIVKLFTNGFNALGSIANSTSETKLNNAKAKESMSKARLNDRTEPNNKTTTTSNESHIHTYKEK